jgi:hypothetical protein
MLAGEDLPGAAKKKGRSQKEEDEEKAQARAGGMG